MKKSVELKQQRAALIKQMQDLHKRADDAGKFSGEDETQWRAMETQADELETAITRAEKLEALAAEAGTNADNPDVRKVTVPGDVIDPAELAKREAAFEKLFDRALRTRPNALKEADLRSLQEYRGTSTQVVGTDALGGYLVPESWAASIIKYMKAFGGMLEVANVFTTSKGETMHFPYIDDNVGAIITETTSDVVSDMAVAEKTLGAYMYTSKIIKMSYELVQDDGYNLQNALAMYIGERIGRIVNQHLTTGTGTGQPWGVVTRAVNSGVSTAAIDRDSVLDLIDSVDDAYSANGTLMFNKATFTALRKLAIGSADDRPLWVPSMRDGVPSTIEGVPYVINRDMASLGTGNRFMIFGDLKQYYVRQVLGLTIESSWEAYFGSRQVGYNGYLRLDADLIGNANAIKYAAGS